MAKEQNTQNAKDFKLDEALKRLSEIVKGLEQNDSELEQSLTLFEEGIALTRSCHAKLTEAEKKIEILTKVTSAGIETKPLK